MKKCGNADEAASYLAQAKDAYSRWGCTSKVLQLNTTKANEVDRGAWLVLKRWQRDECHQFNAAMSYCHYFDYWFITLMFSFEARVPSQLDMQIQNVNRLLFFRRITIQSCERHFFFTTHHHSSTSYDISQKYHHHSSSSPLATNIHAIIGLSHNTPSASSLMLPVVVRPICHSECLQRFLGCAFQGSLVWAQPKWALRWGRFVNRRRFKSHYYGSEWFGEEHNDQTS